MADDLTTPTGITTGPYISPPGQTTDLDVPAGNLESFDPARDTQDVDAFFTRQYYNQGRLPPALQGPLKPGEIAIQKQADIPMLTKQDAEELYGIPGHLTFPGDTPLPVAKSLYDQKIDYLKRQEVLARQQGGFFNRSVQFGVGFVSQALDPLDTAAAFIPVVGEARYAKWLADAGSVAGRAGVRAGVGAASGVAGQVPISAARFGLAKESQEDYSAAQALLDIAYGGLLGGGLHMAGGGLSDAITGQYRSPLVKAIDDMPLEAKEGALRTAIAQAAEGRPIDVRPIFEATGPAPNPVATSGELFNGFDAAPRTEGIAAAEEAWVGGIADVGDREAAAHIQGMPGYFDYKSALEDTARQTLGDNFTVYRTMSREQYDAWKNGEDIGPVSTTLSRDVADGWRNFAGNADRDTVTVAIEATPNDIVMAGKRGEHELIIDGNAVDGGKVNLAPAPEASRDTSLANAVSEQARPQTFMDPVDTAKAAAVTAKLPEMSKVGPQEPKPAMKAGEVSPDVAAAKEAADAEVANATELLTQAAAATKPIEAPEVKATAAAYVAHGERTTPKRFSDVHNPDYQTSAVILADGKMVHLPEGHEATGKLVGAAVGLPPDEARANANIIELTGAGADGAGATIHGSPTEQQLATLQALESSYARQGGGADLTWDIYRGGTGQGSGTGIGALREALKQAAPSHPPAVEAALAELKAADQLVADAEDAAKGYEQAAICIGRAAE